MGFVLLFLGCAALVWHSRVPAAPARCLGNALFQQGCFARLVSSSSHSTRTHLPALFTTKDTGGAPLCLQTPAAATRVLGKLPGSGGFGPHLFLCPATGNPDSLHTPSQFPTLPLGSFPLVTSLLYISDGSSLMAFLGRLALSAMLFCRTHVQAPILPSAGYRRGLVILGWVSYTGVPSPGCARWAVGRQLSLSLPCAEPTKFCSLA